MSRRTEKPSGTQSVAPFGRIRRFHSRRIAGEAGTASYLLAPSSSSQSSPGVTRSKYRPCAIRESLRPQSIVAMKGRWGTIADSRGVPETGRAGQAGARIMTKVTNDEILRPYFVDFSSRTPAQPKKPTPKKSKPSDVRMHRCIVCCVSRRPIAISSSFVSQAGPTRFLRPLACGRRGGGGGGGGGGGE